MPPSTTHHQNQAWASDGSMIPTMSGLGDEKSVMAAVMGPQMLVV